jgi:hypothetical protein
MTAIVPAWTGIGDHQVRDVGHGADHVERDDRDAERLDFLDGLGDVAAHDRTGEQEGASPVEVGDGPDGRGQVLLADERDRVDADLLAAEVVAVRFADRAEDGLGDLGPAADDDEPLAEDLVEGLGQAAAAKRRQPVEDAP